MIIKCFLVGVFIAFWLLAPYFEVILERPSGSQIETIIYIQSTEEFTTRIENGKLTSRFDSYTCCAATITILGNCPVLYINDVEMWRKYCIFMPQARKE